MNQLKLLRDPLPAKAGKSCVTWKSGISARSQSQFASDRKSSKLTHKADKLFDQQVVIVCRGHWIGLKTRLLQRISPSRPIFTEPVPRLDAGLTKECIPTKRYAKVLCCCPLYLVHDVLLIHRCGIHCSLIAASSLSICAKCWQGESNRAPDAAFGHVFIFVAIDVAGGSHLLPFYRWM